MKGTLSDKSSKTNAHNINARKGGEPSKEAKTVFANNKIMFPQNHVPKTSGG